MMDTRTNSKARMATGKEGTATEQTRIAERLAAAFGLAAAITVIFNTVLALVKDAYDPLNQLMVRLTGHHWISHALFDLVMFFLLGWIMTMRGAPASGLSNRLVVTLVAAVVIAGAGLGAWFLFF
jgi:hypothetical protein